MRTYKNKGEDPHILVTIKTISCRQFFRQLAIERGTKQDILHFQLNRHRINLEEGEFLYHKAGNENQNHDPVSSTLDALPTELLEAQGEQGRNLL